MATKQDFVDFIIDQIRNQDKIRYKKMFGDYAIYYDNKVVALCCDNKLYIKPLASNIDIIGKENLVEAKPFEGSKNWFLIEEEIENSELIQEL